MAKGKPAPKDEPKQGKPIKPEKPKIVKTL
jgi:hypothetical protein